MTYFELFRLAFQAFPTFLAFSVTLGALFSFHISIIISKAISDLP